jgi:hypothetical protein
MSKNPEFASPEYPEGGDCAQHSAVVADSPETCRVIRLPSGRNIRCVTPYSLNLPFFCRFHGMFWYTVPPPQALLPARII